MAVIQVKIIDKYGTVLETKEIQDFQLETYKQAGYNVTTLEQAQIEITPEVLNLISQIESGELTVPQNFIDVEVINVKNGNISSERFMRQFNQLLNAGIISTGTQITSYNYSTPYGTFTTNTETEQEALQQKESYIQEQSTLEADRIAQAVAQAKSEAEQKSQEQQSQIDELKTQIQNIGAIPEAYAEEQQDDSSFTFPMVSQLGIEFELKNNRVTGRVALNKITANWNPYYNDINLFSTFELRNKNGIAISSLGQVKQNIVKFPPSQPPLLPSQELTFDESAVDYKELQVRIYLWTQDPSIMTSNMTQVAEPLIFTVKEDSVPIDVVNPSDNKVKRDDFMSKAVGIFGGLLGISLLISGNRKV